LTFIAYYFIATYTTGMPKLKTVTHSLVLLKMGTIIAQNMLSWLELLISRYCCI